MKSYVSKEEQYQSAQSGGKVFYKYMGCLSFEMTRRCNMSCKFCAKGTAQNIDITPKIIDKTLDEMEGVHIETLRITGGEPFLADGMIEYLVDEIIRRRIYITRVSIFTNGTIQSERIAQSLKKLTQYLRSIEKEIETMDKFVDVQFKYWYKGIEDKKIGVIVSTHGHDTSSDEVDQTINFYRSKVDDEDFAIVSQSDSFDELGLLILEGNAKENYRELIGELSGDSIRVNALRILDNNYFFVDKMEGLNDSVPKDAGYIDKTLTVSSNGNVFPGCFMSYKRVDLERMFNIFDCKHDFFERVERWCWKHPIDEAANKRRQLYKTLQFCLKHNIKTDIQNGATVIIEGFLNSRIDRLEQVAHDMHKIYPYFYFDSIDAISTAIVILEMYEGGETQENVELFARQCTTFREEDIKRLSPEWCRGFILFLTQKHEQIEKQMKEKSRR